MQRRDWFDSQPDLEPERLVFIDETWTATNMTRSHGCCRKGERLRTSGMVAPMVLEGPIHRVLSACLDRQSKGANGSKPT